MIFGIDIKRKCARARVCVCVNSGARECSVFFPFPERIARCVIREHDVCTMFFCVVFFHERALIKLLNTHTQAESLKLAGWRDVRTRLRSRCAAPCARSAEDVIKCLPALAIRPGVYYYAFRSGNGFIYIRKCILCVCVCVRSMIVY